MRQRTIVPGSWHLGGPRHRWPTSGASGLTVGTSLTLSAMPDGPRSLRSQEGTLGGLVLPPTLAVDAGVVWLIDREAGELRRFEPLRGRFASVPGWGSRSGGAQWFGRRAAIAAGCGHLAVADSEREDVVFVSTRTMTVRAVLDLAGRRPVSVAAHCGRFHVLDDRGDLWETSPAMDRLVRTREPGRQPEGTYTRVAVYRDGRVLKVDEAAGRVLVPDRAGDRGVLEHAEAVRSAIQRPALTVDPRGRFRVPACFRLVGSDPATWFDARGEPVTIAPDEYAGPPPYARNGWWTSTPFDSGELGCRWYRLTAMVTSPAAGTCSVETYTSDDEVAPERVREFEWSHAHRIGSGTAPLDTGTDGDQPTTTDLAVVSPRGRYLVVRIRLDGDGWSTPSVDRVLVEPETPGLDRFLPAVYRDEDSDFLRRLLAAFGTELDGVEQALRSLPARFSPRAVPAELLDTLAAELGVPLERTWSAAQRRTMLIEAPRWHRRRGTPDAIRALVRTHLEATSGRDLPSSVPVLVEGFRERPGALLGRVTLPMGAAERTWSDSVVDRPVLGRRGADRIGLVAMGEPRTDRFRVHAHRFKVVVPRPLVPGRTGRVSLERLIAAEKPAHVAHELVLVEPRAVVGQQGWLGVDTYVGDYPAARLARAGCDGGRTLGLGLRLGSPAGMAGTPAEVGRGGRVGLSRVLV
jgi:phage tail-like protein